MRAIYSNCESKASAPDTLGASIALQYGLDYPDEVKGVVLMTVAARPKVNALIEEFVAAL